MARGHRRRREAALAVCVRTAAVAAGSLIAVAATTSSASAQAIQLSQSTSSFGVRSFSWAFTPGGRVTYVSGFSVCSAPLNAAGQQIQLSATGTNTFGFSLTADRSRAFFTGGVNPSTGPTELYSVRTDQANSQIQLSTPSVAGTYIDTYDFTPDGSRVAYSQNKSTGSESWQFRGVYSAPGDVPGASLRLDSLPLDSQYRAIVKIAPGGQSVAYVAGNDFLPTPDRNNLYTASMNASGTQLKKSNDTSTLGIDSSDLWFTPNGSDVAYHPSAMPGTVWSAPAAGAGAQLALGTSASTPRWLPDHSRLYFASPASNSAKGTDLFLATPGNAAAKVKLNGSHVTGGEASPLFMTPSAQQLVFLADYNTDGVNELYSATFASPGQHVRLNDPALAGRIQSWRDAKQTPTGERVFYTADTNGNGIHDLYSAVVGQAGSQIKISGAGPNPNYRAQVGSAFASPDGATYYYQGDYNVDNRFEWYAASTAAAGTQRRLFTDAQLGHVLEFGVSGDGQWLYYTYDENNSFSSAEGLYMMPAAGGLATRLAGSTLSGGTVGTLSLAPDGKTLLFLADAAVLGRKELFSAVLPEPGFILPGIVLAFATSLKRRRSIV